MKIEYSYGILGYFMKYLGGLVLLFLSIVFILFPILVVFTGWHVENLVSAIIILCIFIPMAILTSKGVFYCFRYAGFFTKRYIITEDYISIIGKNTVDTYNTSEVKNVSYYRALKLFEINLMGNSKKKLVLMNNGQHETSEFLELKDYFLSYKNVLIKWF
jgi:hypothetical protein